MEITQQECLRYFTGTLDGAIQGEIVREIFLKQQASITQPRMYHLFQRDEARGVGGADTRSSVLHWLVRN